MLLLLITVQFVFGQAEQANITGTITDTSKSIVVDARVTIRNIATNVTNRTVTNSAGLYYIRALPPGTYQLTVEKAGFRSSRVDSIPLTVGSTATVDLSLQVGTVMRPWKSRPVLFNWKRRVRAWEPW